MKPLAVSVAGLDEGSATDVTVDAGIDATADATAVAAIKFGTDGWRAIIGEDFNTGNLARLAEATAKVYREDNPLDQSGETTPNTLIIGYDCRENAGRYAVLVATVLASYGFDVLVSNSYCPTPTLCWSVAHNPLAVGGLMLTSSHNPAEYLGLKLRMTDGGASPKAFTDRVEAALTNTLPDAYADALALAEQAINGTPDNHASTLALAPFQYVDLMTPYLDNLVAMVDAGVIAAARLRVVVDPLYGAGRGYLAKTLCSLGVEVVEVNGAADPTFAGLHPEPILPWIQHGLDKVVELGYDAVFITDGDADRIGAGDSQGNFVNPHRILALVIALLVEDKGQRGRVVRTLSGSNLVKRQCQRLGLELTTTPIGFKWIYEQMLAGDVMIGGEESGGIGIPSNVRERDGLMMTLLLVELMAQKQKTLGQLVAELLETLGNLDYARRDLRLSQAEKDAFLRDHVTNHREPQAYQPLFDVPPPDNYPSSADVPTSDDAPIPPVIPGLTRNPDASEASVNATKLHNFIPEQIIDIDYRDGIKFSFASDAWLLARPSGTEPLVRVYAEAATPAQVENLLDIGCAIVVP